MKSRHLSQLDKALLGLRSLILTGEFAEGQRLSEVAVAKRLGLSRTPLRQAMDRLVAEGLLERIRTGGCRVAVFTKEDIADAIEIRSVIEGTAARMAAERGPDPKLLADAEASLDQIDAALNGPDGIDFDQYVHENARFHDLIAQLSGSTLIQREAERMALLPFASPSAFLSDQALIPDFQDSLGYAQRQHRSILDAIKKREGSRAEAVTREHARLALVNLNYLTDRYPVLTQSMQGLPMMANG